MHFYHIIRHPEFIRVFEALDEYHQERIRRFMHQLSEKGPFVGKPLGYSFLREKKFNGQRLYFLSYDEWRTILLVMISDKKEQRKTIALIKLDLLRYRELVFNTLKKEKII